VPSAGYGYGFYGHYYQSYQQVYRPGYKKTDTIADVQASLFTTSDNQLVWAGKTVSTNPKSVESTVKKITNILTSDMKNRGIVK